MNTEAAILAGTFVGCAITSVAFAAILFGMFPSLSCSSCKRNRDPNENHDPWHDEWMCCLAAQWCCLRFCGWCRPIKLRKSLIAHVALLETAEREAREQEEKEEKKRKEEKEKEEKKRKEEKEKEEKEKKEKEIKPADIL